MALTKIKTGGLADNSVTDAKVADAITVTGAQTGITQVGTLTALTGGTGDLNWDSATLFVDSSANSVGIGSSSPANVLEIEFDDDTAVYTPANIADNTASGILITNTGTSVGRGGMLKFASKDGDNMTAIVHTQEGNDSASLRFFTESGGTLAQRLLIDHDGKATFASTITVGGDLTIPQKIVHSGDTDTYLSFGDDSLSLYTGGTNVVDFIYGNIYIKGNNKALVGYNASGGAKELIKIDGSDVVQIGEGLNAAFAGTASFIGMVTSSMSGTGFRTIHASTTSKFTSLAYDGLYTAGAQHQYIQSAQDIKFYPGGTSAVTFSSNGRLGINRTSPNSKLDIEEASNGQEMIHLNHTNTTNDQFFLLFKHDGSVRGHIKVTNSNDQIAYNTTNSDKRLKKDFENWDESVLPAFESLKPQLFNFIHSKNNGGKRKGYIAQDNVDNFPEAYSKGKALDDDNTEYYSFNPSGMVTYLMKAVQELSAKVTALENA
mgnify:CR=1 FL=1|tara:strand:+ start:930 stop:2399 length:1470 start_codon:yes stop_codon:yes gene_type:complete